MFKLFKKKSEREKLQQKYEKLLEKSFQLSTTNRMQSDKVRAEAEEVLKKMEALED